jgi:catechol 2,3-dioxygenase-like lactoylglutathione lyase family enzyme
LIVERTDFISVPVTNMERATSFYRDTFGLPQVAAAPAFRSSSSVRT